MSLQKLCAGLLSAVVLASFSGAANAQTNVSNASGYNSSNAHGYTTGANRIGVGRYSEAIVSRATQLNQALATAQQQLVDAEYRTTSKYNEITRYARQAGSGKGAGAGGADCPPSAAALAELERAKSALAQANAEAASFMQTVSPTTENITKVSERTACNGCW
jgi:hypothetical protein